MSIDNKFESKKRVSGGIYSEVPPTVSDGDKVALSLDNTGRVKLHDTPFSPQAGNGQAIAFGAAAVRSTQLTTGSIYWVWTTEAAWISFGDNTVVATAIDFPLPPGAVVEYTPASGRDYISALQVTGVGVVYIGMAAA